ncbi:MAG: hypothetical protein LCH81_15185 [Bacteroidetes bacterium]|nr:hypothetical protein [Bacteroidota bacterium]
MINKIKERIYDFFVNSYDFNGIPLRQISTEFKIKYKPSIDIIKSLVEEGAVSIQSSTNPHIIFFQHYPTEIQLKILEDAKKIKARKITTIGDIVIMSEGTEYPICLFPSQSYLYSKRDLSEFSKTEYTRQLALGEPQLKPIFFEIEVLERYINDPRFDFKFDDYSGGISCKYDDEGNNPIVREEDQIFLKTFGLGFDESGKRLAVVYLRYLKDLTWEHQVYWKSKEASGDCKMVKEYHDNTVNGSWTFSSSIFSAFIGESTCLNQLAIAGFGKPIFQKEFNDEKRPKEFTFFFTPTLKNYNEFILLLDKMISDNINKEFFNGEIELYEIQKIEEGLVERKPKGTLRLFEEWLTSKYSVQDQNLIKEVFEPFKNVRKERQNPAHKINENVYDEKYTDRQREVIKGCYDSVRLLRQIFQRHPKARNVEIPNWLDSGNIKEF